MLNEEIMKVNVDNLTKLQIEFLKGHIVEILNKVINCVQEDKFEELEKMLVFSSSGDWGEDNYFINFGYSGNDPLDINQILGMIQHLQILDKKRSKKI